MTTEKQIAKIKTKAEQVIKLSSLSNIAHRIAKAHIKYHGYYTCKMITTERPEGILTFVEK